jgi:hypothetical protein
MPTEFSTPLLRIGWLFVSDSSFRRSVPSRLFSASDVSARPVRHRQRRNRGPAIVESDHRSIERRPDRCRVPFVVVQWLLLVAATFAAGCLTIALLPSDQAAVCWMGVYINVAMAIGIGAVLTWRGIPQRLICGAMLGAVVTVVGWNCLVFTLTEIQVGHPGFGVVVFDIFALPVAACGMAILLSVGGALGGIGRMLSSRCRCGRSLPWLGSPIP